MATHSEILAGEIPWTEEPGRLQSIGSQRVGHNLATEHTRIISDNIKCSLRNGELEEWVAERSLSQGGHRWAEGPGLALAPRPASLGCCEGDGLVGAATLCRLGVLVGLSYCCC